MSEQEGLHFKTNVQLKSIIGKDLINDDNIAILELVKNSFDADAKQVRVSYLNLKDNNDSTIDGFSDKTSRLIIQDDGVGMSIKDIQDKWLNIAYSEKKSNKNQHNRRMAGAKGVGRFSCDRLGEFLNLYARKSKNEKFIKLSIDWKKFEVEDENKEIQSIPLQYELIGELDFFQLGLNSFDHGVLLEVIKLRSSWVYPLKDKNGNVESWDTDKLVELKKYLEKLINPNQAFESNDFGIFIDVPEFLRENNKRAKVDQFIGKVENRIFEGLNFKTTSVEVKTHNGGHEMITTLKDKGDVIFWIIEKNIFYPHVKNAKATVYYLSTYAKSFFTRQTGIRSVDYGSIFLFINGFRIPPYGDDENDWLGIDHRKAQGHSRNIGLREIVGQIEISDEYNDFQIISSREGIVRNDNFKQLTQSNNNNSFFFKAFRRLERYVVEGLNWDSSIYDSTNKEEGKLLREIESKIIAGEISEDELIFREDEETKKTRVYTSIHSILSVKASEVKELYINENLITRKIHEEKKASEQEFRDLIKNFENQKIDSDALNRVLLKRSQQDADLDKQLKEFSKYNTNDATTKALLELQDYKQVIQEQTILINDLKSQLSFLEDENKSVKERASTYKSRVERLEDNLSIEKDKNLYLLATRRTLSADADGLIHTIKVNNIEVRDGIGNIIEDLTDNNFDIQDLIKRLGFLKLNAERSLKMAEFATRADLKEDIERKEVDIVTYIQEYITLYGKTYSDKINFNFIGNNVRLSKNLSVLNLSIIIDNLISNSIKWGAKNVVFEFRKVSEKQILLLISDDGAGLSNIFKNDPDKIFELSVRAVPQSGWSGSGIGLYYTKKLLNEMNCDIEVLGNNFLLSGLSFKITFNAI